VEHLSPLLKKGELVTETKQMHRITGNTRLLFMLADPVAHIRGNALLTEFFQSKGADAAMIPLHVHPENLRTVLVGLRSIGNVVGIGITTPHKIAVVPLLDQLTDRARDVGAVNFVKRDAQGGLWGDNIDGLGFVAGLQASGVEPLGMEVLQVGAGGAGRAIAFALAAAGVSHLRIVNRSVDRAAALAAAVQDAHPGCRCDSGVAESGSYGLVVNTTSLGTRPDDALPLSPELLSPRSVFAEVIMTPAITPMMAAAQARGCRVVEGNAMLVGQMEAAARFAGLW
jgi:shikimate dehydrogenase